MKLYSGISFSSTKPTSDARQRVAVPRPRTRLLWNDRNSIDSHQEVGVCQPGDEHHGVGRRVWSVTPPALAYFKGGLNGLPVDDVDIPLDEVFQPGSSGFETRLDVLQGLFRLRRDVSFPNNGT